MAPTAHPRREAGQGTITFDTSVGLFTGTLDLSRNPQGHRVRVKVSGRTRNEIPNKLDKARRDREHGADLTARPTTFADLADLWLARGLPTQTSENTRENYTTPDPQPPATGTGVLDHVRTRVLNLALDLEKLAPKAGELDAVSPDLESVHTMVTNKHLRQRQQRRGREPARLADRFGASGCLVVTTCRCARAWAAGAGGRGSQGGGALR